MAVSPPAETRPGQFISGDVAFSRGHSESHSRELWFKKTEMLGGEKKWFIRHLVCITLYLFRSYAFKQTPEYVHLYQGKCSILLSVIT